MLTENRSPFLPGHAGAEKPDTLQDPFFSPDRGGCFRFAAARFPDGFFAGTQACVREGGGASFPRRSSQNAGVRRRSRTSYSTQCGQIFHPAAEHVLQALGDVLLPRAVHADAFHAVSVTVAARLRAGTVIHHARHEFARSSFLLFSFHGVLRNSVSSPAGEA